MRFGLDFGTTNSSLAWIDGTGTVQLARFAFADGAETESFRSLLYLEKTKQHGRVLLQSWSGPAAIDRYLAAETPGRLIQSLKSFLSNRSLEATEIFGRRYTIEELIARMLRDLREAAEACLGQPVRRVTAGRPVRFVGSESDDDDEFALARLRKAYTLAGFEEVDFAMEPLGAARYYQSRLETHETILIGDFGGGTSDFSLLAGGRLLGNAGVGVAGDAFDAKVVRRLVSPALGAGSQLRSGEKLLPVPVWPYRKLERWHHLSLLRSSDVSSMLHGVRAQALEPEKIEAFMHVVRENLGFRLHKAVQETKVALSAGARARFAFTDGHIELASEVTRGEFEAWIAEELAAIEECVDGLLATAGVGAGQVQRVFLTGGSSFVPAVRGIFERRFGAECLSAGHEFTSVARGLAILAGC